MGRKGRGGEGGRVVGEGREERGGRGREGEGGRKRRECLAPQLKFDKSSPERASNGVGSTKNAIFVFFCR